MRLRSSIRRTVLGATAAAAMSLGTIGPAQAQSARPHVVQFSTGDSSYLGIQMEDVTAANMATYKLGSERGVVVQSVEKGSPAETAGLQPKDVITEYAGMPVFSSMQMARLVRETPAGRKVAIGVSRDGRKVNVAATIGKREGAGGVERGFQFFRHDGEPGEDLPQGPRSGGRVFRMPPNMGDLPFGPGGGGWGAARQERPRLGVALQPLTDQMAAFLGVPGKQGVVVVSVTEGSAAAGKLKAGDVIIKADGGNIASPEDLTRFVQEKEDGATVEFRVIRDKKEITVQIQLPSSSTYKL